MSQNRSHAVMAQRHEAADSLDFFPTPPWATRALCEHVLIGGGERRDTLLRQSCHEPACGMGDMARPLAEYFSVVRASDCFDYGFGEARDFLMPGRPLYRQTDWIVTNPPFRLAQAFIARGNELAQVGVAMLVRTVFIEGASRYRDLFAVNPPSIVAPFSERVPMVKGRLDRSASSATSYCWIVWQQRPPRPGCTVVRWIPPCRKALERDDDYAARVTA